MNTSLSISIAATLFGFAISGAAISSAQTTKIAEVSQLAQIDDTPIEKRLEQDMITMPNMVQALSKNLGQLHFLRTVCFGETDQTWRTYASKMMDVEAPNNAEDRRKLIDAFNAGFYDQQGRHAGCSNKVSTEAAALAENARHLASMLGDPYRE